LVANNIPTTCRPAATAENVDRTAGLLSRRD
jgi:hypothetical protein